MKYNYTHKRGHKIVSRRIPAYVKRLMQAVVDQASLPDEIYVMIIAKEGWISQSSGKVLLGTIRPLNRNTYLIRLSLAGDALEETLAHELGHLIDHATDTQRYYASTTPVSERFADKWAKKLTGKKVLKHTFERKYYKREIAADKKAGKK